MLRIATRRLLGSTRPNPLFLYSITIRRTLFLPPAAQPITGLQYLATNDVVSSFKTWFKSRNDYNNINKNAVFDQIYAILNTPDDDDSSPYSNSADFALSQLGLRLNEAFVLQALRYGDNVLSCLKFFDWAGRQPGFVHTPATFNCIFRILSRAKLMSLMLDFLDGLTKQRFICRTRFYDTLVIGYAIAGKPDVALQLFGTMRFKGLDLDEIGYHVFLNALVEDGCFDLVEVIVKQIRLRGYERTSMYSIVVKSLCKQMMFDEAEEYLKGLVSSGKVLNGHTVLFLIDALCKGNRLGKAGKLVEEFTEGGVVGMENAYHVWIRNLVRVGKVDEALEFFQRKKLMEGYLPDVLRYNMLVCRLLRENRLKEVSDLLMEMKESEIVPDRVTLNAALCFFCKAGMVNVALELYNMRTEVGLSLNSMGYNYLINTLCGDGSTEEAYRVLKNSVNQGYFPGLKAFEILANALCREKKLDKMKELIIVSLEHNVMLSEFTYEKFISALCKTKRAEDGYLVYGELSRIKKLTNKSTYCDLIYGLIEAKRGDIAARVLVEMQEMGLTAHRKLFRAVIQCQLEMENPETQFFKLIKMQLSRHEPSHEIYRFFMEGAGCAKRPDLSRIVFEMMQRGGCKPTLKIELCMLLCYLKTGKISDAINFFNDIRQRRKAVKKLYNLMIVGLCNANRETMALDFFNEIRGRGRIPSLECYEILVKSFCSNQKYDTVIQIINDLEKAGRGISSFIGNTLLLHALKSEELYRAWVNLRDVETRTSPSRSLLDKLIALFSGHIEMSESIDDLEEVIRQCFPIQTYTYNLLLSTLSRSRIDLACALVSRMSQKGYKPDRRTYDILVRGLYKHEKIDEAKSWTEEMIRKGFEPV